MTPVRNHKMRFSEKKVSRMPREEKRISQNGKRIVIHVDMDAFFASVEELDHPEYRGKPVIVGGTVEGRGVVSAASYEARRFGIHSAMPMAQAKRLCPRGIFTSVRGRRYAEVSTRIREIFLSYTPLVEPISLDEAYLDVTASQALFGPAIAIGQSIKRRIRDEIGLSASVGIAPNKFLAKIASDIEKPGGFVVVPEDLIGFLAPLPIERLWGVGKKTSEALHRRGLRKVMDLQALGRERMRELFGNSGDLLFDLAMGKDKSPVIPESEAKSIGNETTFPTDVADPAELRKVLLHLAETVGHRLRKEGYYGKTVQIKVRFPSFATVTRDETLPFPTQSDQVIFDTGLRLLGRANPKGEPIRLLGIGTKQLIRSLIGVQLLLFDDRGKRLAALDQVVDKVRERFGKQEIQRGRTLK
jgi:DNA polymerase-4